MLPSQFRLRNLILRFLCPCACALTTGWPHFLLSEPICTDRLSVSSLPTSVVQLAVDSCQALLHFSKSPQRPIHPRWLLEAKWVGSKVGSRMLNQQVWISSPLLDNFKCVPSKQLLPLNPYYQLLMLALSSRKILQSTHEWHLRLTDVKEGPLLNQKVPGFGATGSRNANARLCLFGETEFRS